MLIGLKLNTRRLSVSIMDSYVIKVHAILHKTWHVGRHQFYVGEAHKLAGKIARLAAGADWVYHLISCMYALVAFALAQNELMLHQSSLKTS